jgi:hypothetical protein
MDEARLEALLKEATAHCFDEEDEFWGVFSALVRGISLPLQASLSGEAVTFVGLDGRTSNLEAGVMALVRKGNQEEAVPLSELEMLDPDPVSTEWLAAYRYWLSK